MENAQRSTGSSSRIHDPDQPVGAGPAPASAAKGAVGGGALAIVVGALLGAPFGLIEFMGLAVGVRILVCAVVGAVALSVVGGLIGGWVGLGSANKQD